jgi:hypothetical protein
MKISYFTNITALLMYSLFSAHMTFAQNVGIEKSESSTAILDTALPFAIGAREGEQSIRGAFGWPTFQEGFVEGVYFRFDPDGYARFSTSPRLDEDVFEVTCQNATTMCIAKKGGFEIGLTAQGQPQLRISGLTQIDKFFISDRKNELPLPNSILGPIDQKLEALLSSGGDLIIRRELETLQTLSLSGFSATVTFLRWVAQNQASFIFPRGWPVPSQVTGQQNVDLTLPQSWENTNSATQTDTTELRSQYQQPAAKQTFNNSAWPNVVVNNEVRQTPSFNTEAYELSAVGFAEQAQARSLPADVNRFKATPSHNGYEQTNIQSANPNSTSYATANIELQIGQINKSIKNLEVMIGNIATQISFAPHQANTNEMSSERSLPKVYKSLGENSKETAALPRNPIGSLSEEDKLRQLVIDSLLQKTQQEDTGFPSLPNKPAAGEISVKKSIVERLLEELNSADETVEKTEVIPTKSSTEFISLSDYINKIMQEEAK